MREVPSHVRVAFVAGLLGTGCFGSQESSIVTFRDPHEVAVDGEMPDGTRALLGAREHKEVVVGTFQYLRLSNDYEILSRRQDGAILLTSTDPYHSGIDVVLVDADGRMERQDVSPEVFLKGQSRASDRVFIPFVVPLAPANTLRGWLVSPWANVAEVKRRTGADPRVTGGTFGGTTLLVLGTALAGFGTWLAIDAAQRAHTGTSVIGVGLGALGLTCDAWTLYQLLGPSHEEVVYARDPRAEAPVRTETP